MNRLAKAITIRPASADDHSALARLAALDSATPPPAPAILAEVEGELRAAVSLFDGSAVADPFFPSTHLVTLLRTHARWLEQPATTRRRRDRRRGLIRQTGALRPGSVLAREH